MKIQKTIGAGVLSLGLLVGLSGFDAGATSRSIGHTGAHSYNKIKTEIKNKVRVHNDNDINVKNNNYQEAYTGDATVKYNTTGGDAYTGDATNENSLNLSATVNNSGSADAWAGTLHNGGGGGSASIDHTGYYSDNVITHEVSTKIDVHNDNDIKVTNNNEQTAVSGDAIVKGNTTGGDAVSGDATNTNSTSVTLNITN